jgi:dolichol-phosphate hexosyltransferase
VFRTGGVVVVKLSILMPVYNEEDRIGEAVKQALATDYPCGIELIVIDDGSRDGTSAVLATLDDPRLRVITHPRNAGKGAAIRTGADAAEGRYMVILDADLEYDPRDIPTLLDPVLDGRATVVYGNRAVGSHSSYSFWYVVGNKAVTTVANMLFDSYIGDLETGFKLMPTDLYRSLDVRSPGFGAEAELTAKLLRRRIRPYEVPVSYRARNRDEGKKITWRAGVEAMWILGRERTRRTKRERP